MSRTTTRVVGALRAAYVRLGVRDRLPMPARFAVRSAWVRTARRLGAPAPSPRLPSQRLPPRRRPLELSHVVLACDLNPRYLESWPLVAPAWREAVGIEPVLVLIAAEDAVPAWAADDPAVRVFPPADGLHTAFQAQCIRLLYPALLETDGGVLISDMELVPLDPGYFTRPPATVDESVFVSYRDLSLEKAQIVMGYNAARPETWAEVFGVASEGDVRGRLVEWGSGREYDTVRGGAGWYTDQEALYAELLPWGARTGRHVLFDDAYTRFRRLDRPHVEAGLPDSLRRRIAAGAFTDFNSLIPHGEHRELNEEVVALARTGWSRRARRRR